MEVCVSKTYKWTRDERKGHEEKNWRTYSKFSKLLLYPFTFRSK